MRKALRLILALAMACTLIVPAFGYSTMVVYNAEIEPPHVVTFDPCNGTDPIQVILYEDGYVEELPTPASTAARGVSGYTFDGWHIDSTTPFTTATFVDKDMTVYGRWEKVPTNNNSNNNNTPNNTPSTPNNGSNGSNGSGSSGSSGVAKPPKTFDAGIAHYCVMALASTAAGSAIVLTRKKYAA